MPTDPDITSLLMRAAAGDADAVNGVFPLVYEELRRLAESHLKHERRGHTLQATALVNEVYVKLVNQKEAKIRSRAQFMAIASQAMRRILVNHARDRARQKRGGEAGRVDLDQSALIAPEPAIDLVAVDEALVRLAALDARKARVVEMRFFGGMNGEEIAESLGIASATVQREWRMARAWLVREISGVGGHAD